MAAAGQGSSTYDGTGAGGKFRKKPFRRSQATPYDRPPIAFRNPSIGINNNNSSFLSKFVDPASKLIYAGAHRLFGVFRNRLTLPPPERLPPEANQEPNDRLGEVAVNLLDRTRAPEERNNQNEDSFDMSGAAEISELEKMLKQRSFTRSEMERLTELLRSRTSDLPVEDEREGKERKAQANSPNPNRNDSEIFRASVSAHFASSVVPDEGIASPAELAKAYMGNRPSKVSPSILGSRNEGLKQDYPLLGNGGSVFPKSPSSFQLSLASKATKGVAIPENGFTTPRSRGRSAIYNMARTPYSRIYSADRHKGIVSYGGPSSSMTPSLSAREQEGPVGSKQSALKRRSSVLEDDIGSVGPMRRIRQKPNLLSQGGFLSARGREYGSGAAQYLASSSEKMLLTNGPEHKIHNSVEKNGDPVTHFSRYASVPTKSSEMASKILQHLEKMSPKEKPSQTKGDPNGKKSPSKLTSSMLHGQALRSMDTMDSPKYLNNVQESHKSGEQPGVVLPGVGGSTLQKDNVEENGSKKSAVPRNFLMPLNSDATVSGRENGSSSKNAVSSLKIAAEPPPKKRSFQMSAHEDFLELDDEIHSNGATSTPVVEKDEKLKKPVIGLAEAASPSKSPAFPVSNTAAASFPIQRANFGSSNGSAVGEKETGVTYSSVPAISTTYQPPVLAESISTVHESTPLIEAKTSPSSTVSSKTADKVEQFAFTSSVPKTESEVTKINSWTDAKPDMPSSLVNVASVTTNGQAKFPINKVDDYSTQNTVNGIKKLQTVPPPAESTPPVSSSFSFGIPPKNLNVDNNENATNVIGSANTLPSLAAPVKSVSFSFGGSTKDSDLSGTHASNPSTSFSTTSVLASSNFSNQFLNNSSPSLLPSTTGTTTSSSLSTASASPNFSFGSSVTPGTATSASALSTTSVAETTDTKTKKDPEPPSFNNSNTSSLFGDSTFASKGNLFGFNSSTTSSTEKNQSQGSLFSTGSGSNVQASSSSTQSAPFQFGSTTTSVFGTSGSTTLTPTTSPFGSSASTSANPFTSTTSSFSQTSSDAASGAAASAPSIFGTGWQPAKTSVFGSTQSSPSPSTGFSFGASSTIAASTSSAAPSMVFGSTTTTPVSSPVFSFGAVSASTKPTFPSFSQTQSVFGNSNPTFPSPSANGNDQMGGMEDSMAEDPMHSPSPSPAPLFGQPPAPSPVFGQTPAPSPVFGQTPAPSPVFGQPPSPSPVFGQPPSSGFMFGTSAPAQGVQGGVPFQFGGGQPNAAAPVNPFQASSSLEFNGGGSFSLGSGGGGGDKSGRRTVRISKNKNRKK